RTAECIEGAPSQSGADVSPPQEKALTKARRRIRKLEQKVGRQQLDLGFFEKPCGISRKIVVRTARLAERDFQSYRKDDDGPIARRFQYRKNVLARRRQPCKLLPSLAGLRSSPSRE